MESTGRNDWLVSQSLERSLDIISAINRLSIHSKLRLAGIPDTASVEETEGARKAVSEFLSTLSNLVNQAERSGNQVAFGSDPRFTSLARRFLVDHAQTDGRLLYRAEELIELKTLLGQGDAVEHKTLIEELSRLRCILEQHSQADAAIVFNEM